MKNTVTASISFSFKGECLNPSLIIDLDKATLNSVGNLMHLIAVENNIGMHSYEYEVLESSPVVFSDPSPQAAMFLSGKGFDFKGYYQAQHENKIEAHLQLVAEEYLGKEAWNEPLKNALHAAYTYGATYNETN